MRKLGLVCAAVAAALCVGACRQLAGLQALDPPDGGAEASTDGPATDDGGPGCTCTGCKVLASDLSQPQSMVLVGDTLYWLDPGSPNFASGFIWSVPKTGGRPTKVPRKLAYPLSIATDSTSLYWYETSDAGASVQKMDLKSQSVQEVAASPGFDMLLNGWTAPNRTSFCQFELPATELIALLNAQVLFAETVLNEAGCDEYELVSALPNGASYKLTTLVGTLGPPDGGSSVPEADFLPAGSADQVDPIAVTVSGPTVYWLNSNAGSCGTTTQYSIWKIDGAGGTPVEVTKGLSQPVSLVVVGDTVYVADVQANAIQSVPTSGGTPKNLQPATLPWAMAADGTTLYWSTLGSLSEDGTIVKYDLATRKATVLAQNLAAPTGLTVDSEYVYWVDSTCEKILRVHK